MKNVKKGYIVYYKDGFTQQLLKCEVTSVDEVKKTANLFCPSGLGGEFYNIPFSKLQNEV